MERYYEELDHTADWAIRVWGESPASLFEHAAAAMFELSGADMMAEPTLAAEVECLDMDLETLLVAWLNELLYLSETTDALYNRFRVSIQPAEADNGLQLHAQVRGMPGRGHLAHIKAATYWDLAVRPIRQSLHSLRLRPPTTGCALRGAARGCCAKTGQGWEATVTFDT